MKILGTGILGQDCSILAEKCLDAGHEFYGIYRRISSGNSKTNIEPILHHPRLHLIEGDITDSGFIMSTIADLRPDMLFSLAAQSHVHYSFSNPIETFDVNTMAVIHQLEAIRKYSPDTRFYFSGTSEMYGTSPCPAGGFTESTPFSPRSPYGCSKLASFSITKNYREAYNLFACSGILFNHSSTNGRRGLDFMTRKITHTVAEIKLGLADNMKAGNLESFRDEGAAEEYVDAMIKILGHTSPNDFVVSTGRGATMRQMLAHVCEIANLDIHDVYQPDEKFMRPSDVQYLLGNPEHIRSELGWQASMDWKSVLKEMYEFDLNMLKFRLDRPSDHNLNMNPIK